MSILQQIAFGLYHLRAYHKEPKFVTDLRFHWTLFQMWLEDQKIKIYWEIACWIEAVLFILEEAHRIEEAKKKKNRMRKCGK